MNSDLTTVPSRRRFLAVPVHAVRRVRTSSNIDAVQILWPQVLAIIALLLGAKAGATPFLYVLLIFWALRSHVCALQALTFSFLLGFLNPAFFPGSSMAGLLRLLILGAAAVRIFLDAHYRGVKMSYTLWALMAFGITVASSSLLFSLMAVISVLKVVLFEFGVAAILVGVQLNRGKSLYWQSWFFTLFFVVLCLSLPTYFVPSIGFANNGRGFQGILNQPQAYGLFLGPLTAWLSCAFITRERTSPLFFLSLLLAWFSLFASQARTAFIAIVLSVVLALLVMAVFQSHALHSNFARVRQNKRAFTALIFSITLGLSIALFNWPNIQQGLSDFIHKGVEDTSVGEGFQRSRGFLIEKSWTNFQENPLIGIGFGVPSELSDDKGLGDNVGGIAVSAPTEKGFLPSATLEENGVLGTFFLVVFVGCLLRDCLAKKSFATLCLFLACILVNIGEMIFFSLGGVGLFMWLLMGLALIPEPVKPPVRRAVRA